MLDQDQSNSTPPQPDEKSDSLDEGQLYERQVLFDGTCQHYYVLHHVDSDGLANARCVTCPQGIVYQASEFEVVDGVKVAL